MKQPYHTMKAIKSLLIGTPEGYMTVEQMMEQAGLHFVSDVASTTEVVDLSPDMYNMSQAYNKRILVLHFDEELLKVEHIHRQGLDGAVVENIDRHLRQSLGAEIVGKLS